MLEIIQFFLSGIVFMAEFKVNGKIDNGAVIKQNGKYYVCTGSSYYKNLERHYFTPEHVEQFNVFMKTH